MRSSTKRQPVKSLLAYYEPEAKAAKEIGVSEKTMVGYRKLGIGPPFITIARRIFYSREALAAWIAAGGVMGIHLGLRSLRASFGLIVLLSLGAAQMARGEPLTVRGRATVTDADTVVVNGTVVRLKDVMRTQRDRDAQAFNMATEVRR